MPRIYLSPPHMTGNEQAYIAEAFESNYIAPLGPFVERFEAMVCGATGAKHALATVSGTAAIHLALRVLGVGAGDVVLCSTFTFIGSVAPILYQQATPLFIDSDAKSWNLDPELLRRAIATAPRPPKALIVTHLYGQCAEIDTIVSICREYGIAVIEDAAESIGAEYGERGCGTFGDFGVFSFNGNKLLTTSGGGMLVSSCGESIAKARFYATQAKEAAVHYEHREIGYNYRMSNVLAAIGCAQIEVLEARVARAREIFDTYRDLLGGLPGVAFMPELPRSRGNRWLTTLTFEAVAPEIIRLALEAEDIESRPLWKPMHLQPLFAESPRCVEGVSDALFACGLCLPSGTQMDDAALCRVCDVIRKAHP